MPVGLRTIFALSLLATTPALAWDSAVHTALIQLTRNISQVPGVSNSWRMFITKDIAGSVCYGTSETYVTRKQLTDPLQRTYLELVCGTDEPDRDRSFWKSELSWGEWFLALIENHKADPAPCAQQEFDAAVALHKQGQYAEAARHLGRSLHCISDLTDFSVHLSSYSSDVRARGIAMAQGWLEQWRAAPMSYPADLDAKLNAFRAGLAAQPGGLATTPSDMLQDALAGRIEIAKDFAAFMNDPEAGSPDEKLAVAVENTLLGAIVAQEIWIDLYLKAIAPPGTSVPGQG